MAEQQPDIQGKLTKGILSELESQVEAAVKSVAGGIFDTGAFVANDNVPALAKAPRDIMRAACRSYSTGFLNNPISDQLFDGYCGPYLAANGMGKVRGSSNRQFTGGQCAGVSYRLGITTDPSTPPTFGASVVVTGPIAGVQTIQTQASPPRWNFQVTYGTGQTALVKDVDFGDFSTDPYTSGYNYPIDVTRLDGQPDNCGDGPNLFVVSQPSTGTPPPNWNDTTVIYESPFGDFPVDVTLNPDGSITITNGNDSTTLYPPGITPSSPPGLVPDTDQQFDTSVVGNEGSFENNDTTRELTGVHVLVTQFGPRAKVEFGSVPLIHSAGWLAFGSFDGGFIQPCTRIINVSQLFRSEKFQGFYYKLNPGFVATITPLYSE